MLLNKSKDEFFIHLLLNLENSYHLAHQLNFYRERKLEHDLCQDQTPHFIQWQENALSN